MKILKVDLLKNLTFDECKMTFWWRFNAGKWNKKLQLSWRFFDESFMLNFLTGKHSTNWIFFSEKETCSHTFIFRQEKPLTFSLAPFSPNSKQNACPSSISKGDSGSDLWALCGDAGSVSGTSSLELPSPHRELLVGHSKMCRCRSENRRFGSLLRRPDLPPSEASWTSSSEEERGHSFGGWVVGGVGGGIWEMGSGLGGGWLGAGWVSTPVKN